MQQLSFIFITSSFYIAMNYCLKNLYFVSFIVIMHFELFLSVLLVCEYYVTEINLNFIYSKALKNF